MEEKQVKQTTPLMQCFLDLYSPFLLADGCQPIDRRLSVIWPTAVGQQKGTVSFTISVNPFHPGIHIDQAEHLNLHLTMKMRIQVGILLLNH
jgi:hypothetical protein